MDSQSGCAFAFEEMVLQMCNEAQFDLEFSIRRNVAKRYDKNLGSVLFQ